MAADFGQKKSCCQGNRFVIRGSTCLHAHGAATRSPVRLLSSPCEKYEHGVQERHISYALSRIYSMRNFERAGGPHLYGELRWRRCSAIAYECERRRGERERELGGLCRWVVMKKKKKKKEKNFIINPPTPRLWKAPASTQQTKRETRPAIRPGQLKKVFRIFSLVLRLVVTARHVAHPQTAEELLAIQCPC